MSEYMEEVNAVFNAGHVLERALKDNGYCTDDGCVGAGGFVNEIHYARDMDFVCTEKKITQKILNTFTPKGFKCKLRFFEHKDDDTNEIINMYNIIISIK